jgi:hypothetical protein
MCRASGALLVSIPDPALARWANFSPRLRRWLHASPSAGKNSFDATLCPIPDEKGGPTDSAGQRAKKLQCNASP